VIDLHCHLLPGIDDGAQNMEEALELAHAMVANGIRRCVLTPHMHEGRYFNDRTSLQPRADHFRQTLDATGIDLEVALAAEVRIGFEVLSWLQAGEIPFLGQYEGRDVLLLELPHGNIPMGADKLTARLIADGVQPMMAHPERNKYVLRDLSAIEPFVEMGCLLQVTAGSVAGAFGPPARQRAIELLERGWVHILATDTHNIEWRPPNLAEGRAAAAQIVGEEESWRLVRDKPWEIAEALWL
jgi:protein-tyrosine phosphatase